MPDELGFAEVDKPEIERISAGTPPPLRAGNGGVAGCGGIGIGG
jgi:hypothetical protein